MHQVWSADLGLAGTSNNGVAAVHRDRPEGIERSTGKVGAAIKGPVPKRHSLELAVAGKGAKVTCRRLSRPVENVQTTGLPV